MRPGQSASKDSRVFVLGVGSQKCGTSWLYKYLGRFPEVDMGFIKEYHIWDALYANDLRDTQKEYRVKSDQVDTLNRKDFMRYHMQNTEGFYEGYFNSILNSGAKITGDISPSYCALDEKTLRVIRQKLLSITDNLKVVFLLRDPLERCWSAAKMYKRLGRHEGSSTAEILEQIYSGAEHQARTRYEVAHRNIENVFEPHELYVGIFETMFTFANVKKLSAFLGVSPDFKFAENVVNASRSHEEIPHTLAEDIKHFYRDTYEYCHERFPDALSHWGQR